jgi:hypothetical protein
VLPPARCLVEYVAADLCGIWGCVYFTSQHNPGTAMDLSYSGETRPHGQGRDSISGEVRAEGDESMSAVLRQATRRFCSVHRPTCMQLYFPCRVIFSLLSGPKKHGRSSQRDRAIRTTSRSKSLSGPSPKVKTAHTKSDWFCANLHETMRIRVIVYRAALARRPDEDEL